MIGIIRGRGLRLIVLFSLTLCQAHPALASTDWSAADYDLYSGDFDGDGVSDVLYVARDPAKPSGIARSNGSGPNIPWQAWPSNFLGIPWSANQYKILVADFNNDGKADIFMQSSSAGDSYLLVTASNGKVVGISQTVPNGALGVNWSSDQHRLVTGDFNADGRKDFFLQATSPSGLNAVVLVDSNGQITPNSSNCSANGIPSGPQQCWNDGFLGFRWSTTNALIYAGNFNGTGPDDLLIQAKPKFVLIDYDVPFPVPTYPPNMSGIVYGQAGNPIFSGSSYRPWARITNGADWSPLTNTIVVGDLNGDGVTDIVLQSRLSSRSSYVLYGGASSPNNVTPTTLSSNIAIGADAARLLVGNFGGGRLYVQALSTAGVNYVASVSGGTVSASVHTPDSATTTTLPTAVGRTVGTFSVSPLGAATYAIPIAVPPGVAGIQPQLAISYQSGGSNGLLGVGWSIAGLSEIERCRKTIAQDGANAGITFSSNDVFCLDGNRLRLTSGTYGSPGSTYQTEIETFSRITAVSAAGNGPASFVVEAKNGLRYEYGNTADSRIESTVPGLTTTARVWALNKVSDRYGNTMTITYQEDGAGGNGSFRPLNMSYTTNTSTGLAAAYQVSFVWEGRPSDDTLTQYVAGGLVREASRLKRIDTLYNDPVNGWGTVRKYQLGYNTSGSAPRSRLTSVQECDRVGNCLAPTVIGWQSGTTGVNTDVTTGISGTGAPYAIPADINGDGRTDLFYPIFNGSGVGSWYFAPALASGGYGTPLPSGGIAGSNLVAQFASALPIDYNADGLMDIIVPSNSGQWQILQSSGSGFTVIPTSFSAPTQANRAWVTDINGDGRQDLIYLAGNQTQNATLTILINTPSGFISGGTSTPLGTNAYFNTIASIAGPGQSRSAVQAADFNGDGLADLLVSYSQLTGSAQSGFSTEQRIAVLASTGSGYVLSGVPLATLVQNTGGINAIFDTMRLADFNGDGIADVLYQCAGLATWCVRFGTGAGLGAEVSTGISVGSDPARTLITDWTGDGRADVLEPGSNGNWQLIRATGELTTPFLALIDSGVPSASLQASSVVDVDGNGLLDLQYLDAGGTWHYRTHTAPFPDLVSSITDGFGMSISVQYAPLTDSSIYTKGTGTPASYPEMDVQAPIVVVKQYTVANAVADPGTSAGVYTISESYTGARLALNGRGFEGFYSRTEIDSRTGLRSTSTFNQAFPRTGLLANLTVRQASNLVAEDSTSSYTDLATSTTQYNDRHYVYASAVTQNSYEVSTNPAFNGGSTTRVITTTSVDSYGTPTLVTTNTYDTTSGSPLLVNISATNTNPSSFPILNDEGNWCLGFIQQSEVTNTPSGQSGLKRNGTALSGSAVSR